MKSTKSSLPTETIGAAVSIARRRRTRMKEGGRGCRRSKKNFPPWRPFSVQQRRGPSSLVRRGAPPYHVDHSLHCLLSDKGKGESARGRECQQINRNLATGGLVLSSCI